MAKSNSWLAQCSDDVKALNPELFGGSEKGKRKEPAHPDKQLDRAEGENPPVLTITVYTRPPSANELYAGKGGWKGRHREKQKAVRLVAACVPEWVYQYTSRVDLHVTMFADERPYDSSNVWLAAKMYEDSLVQLGVLKDDDMKCVRRMILESAVDPDNPRVEIKIIRLDADTGEEDEQHVSYRRS